MKLPSTPPPPKKVRTPCLLNLLASRERAEWALSKGCGKRINSNTRAPQVSTNFGQRDETCSTKVTAVRGYGRGGGRASTKENLKQGRIQNRVSLL